MAKKKCTCVNSAPHIVPYNKLLFKTIKEIETDTEFRKPGMYVCKSNSRPYEIGIRFSKKLTILRAAKKIAKRNQEKGEECCFAKVPFQNGDHQDCVSRFIKKTHADTPFDSTYLHVINTPMLWWVPQLERTEIYGPERKQWSFPTRKRKSGIYFIWQDGIFVYVGQSIRSLSETANGHFSPYRENRYYPHYRVCFSDTKFQKKYEIAFLEISPYWFKDEEEFKFAVKKLENDLILCFFDTLLNKKVISKENFYQTQESENLILFEELDEDDSYGDLI